MFDILRFVRADCIKDMIKRNVRICLYCLLTGAAARDVIRSGIRKKERRKAVRDEGKEKEMKAGRNLWNEKHRLAGKKGTSEIKEVDGNEKKKR